MGSGSSGPYRISIFNHKGGVGKTTLTMNLAAALAKLGRRVLLVDSDPQCNLTSYLVDQEVVDDLLDRSDGSDGQTVWSAMKPISEAQGGIREVKPIELAIDNLYLIPGDIRLSEFESDLNEFWGLCLQRKMRGFRGTTALSELVDETSKTLGADYVFYDSGPNIGPLNRVILLDCDFFIVPVAGDLFSLRALKTLGRTLVDWISSWETITDLAPSGTPILGGRPALLGYIQEGFRVYGGQPTKEHAEFFSLIEKEIHSQVIALLRGIDPELIDLAQKTPKLGEVKNFGALIPASQREGLPIYDVQAGAPEQKAEAAKAFSAMAKRIDDHLDGDSL